jgi:hypothetical protein
VGVADEFNALVERETGITFDDAPDHDDPSSDYWTIRHRLAVEFEGSSGVPSFDSERWERLTESLPAGR